MNGSFRALASSLDALILSSMKMHRYIRFDLVWFFFDWSRRIKIPTRNFLWKSSRIVKSSNTCCGTNTGQKGQKQEGLTWYSKQAVVDLPGCWS